MDNYYMLRRYNSSALLSTNNYGLRRSSSLVHLTSDLSSSFRLRRTASYTDLTPRTYSACDFNSQLQISERYKPKWHYTAPYMRYSWPYHIFRDKLHDDYYYDKVYSYSPVYYRYLSHNSYYLPKNRWYDSYMYPHATTYSHYRTPYRHSVYSPYNSAYSYYSYNPIYSPYYRSNIIYAQ
ncbi:hypothetical protein Ddc_01513 [Ditylenchus destructor]|nr:hypothetical protein Ddc_01513 [Ditylenchus destructor]